MQAGSKVVLQHSSENCYGVDFYESALPSEENMLNSCAS